jgi:hypothetical protein
MRKSPEPPAQAPEPSAPYGGSDYRVRVMMVTLMNDIYDEDGTLVERVTTPKPFVIAEKDFPIDMCRLIQLRTDIKDGFYCLRARPKKDGEEA